MVAVSLKKKKKKKIFFFFFFYFFFFFFFFFYFFFFFGCFFFFQAEDGIRDRDVTGVQTCALPICSCSETKSLNRKLTDRGTLTQRGGRQAFTGSRKLRELVPPVSDKFKGTVYTRHYGEIGRASCRERV